jgi:protein DJ-1
LTKFKDLYLFNHYSFMTSSMPSAVVLLSEGAEEMETVITVDVLRRGGIDVTIAGVGGIDLVVCSRNVVIKPDTSLAEAVKKDYDVVVCPGGMKGAETLAASQVVGSLLKKQQDRGALIACICAAPIALKSHGIAKGQCITSHPSVDKQLKEAGYKYSEDRVVIDGKIVTSRGPGTTFEFALALVELLAGKDKREAIIAPMLVKL